MDVRLVIGAAGGTKITSGVAIGMILNLWAGFNIKEAIDARRLHHQVSKCNTNEWMYSIQRREREHTGIIKSKMILNRIDEIV